MKKLFAAMMLVALVAATPVFAAPNATHRVNVPFDFTVAGKAMPAGTYEVADNYTMQTVYIREVSGNNTAIAMATNAWAPLDAQATLAFAVTEKGDHHLVNITRAGYAKDLRPPKVEGRVTLALIKAVR